jgi:hypothetical protein
MDDQPKMQTSPMQQLDKSGWTDLCDRLTRILAGKRAEIEVASLAIGDQIEAEWVALFGITYDHKDDLIEIALEGVDHVIPHPRQLAIQEGPGGLMSVLIVEEDGTEQIIHFREPLLLPPPAAGAA